MADLVPVVTNLSDPATWDAAGIINALNGHTWSSAWSVSDHNVGQGTSLQCDTIGETHSIVFRKLASGDSAHIAVSISPAQPIEDAGDDTPTDPTTTAGGAMGTDWSGDGEWDVTIGTPATGSKLWVCEYPDALLIIVTDPTNAFMQVCCHAGRIYQPFNANASSLGQDGLGFLIGGAADPTSGATADQMFSSGVGADSGLIHYETDLWGKSSYAQMYFGVSTLVASDGTDGETNIFSPPLPIQCDLGGNNPWVGLLKYTRIVGTSAVPKTIKAVTTSNQGFMHVNNAVGALEITFIWDKTKNL